MSSVALTFATYAGDDAAARLRDAAFRGQWRTLAAACPWTTAFQEAAFSDAWWDTYGDEWEPLLCEARNDAGLLRGLLTLARERTTGRATPTGAHHAEYHAWLAVPADGDAFILGAIARLRDAFGVRSLRFHFLAPGAPTGWIARMRGPLAPLALRARHERGLRDLGDGARDREALRRKSARSKRARLARAGAVEYRTVTTTDEFARWLPQIIAQTDARHGTARTPGPFAADPRKASFYRRLMQEAALMHCGVLVRGEQLLASHTGWIDRGTLGLGLITFDAGEQANSPGTLLLHHVGEDAARLGVTTFDLTPGGAYKARFATRQDVVDTIDLHLAHGPALLARLARATRALVRRALRRA